MPRRLEPLFVNSKACRPSSPLGFECLLVDVDHEDIVKAKLLVIIESLGSACGQVNSYESMEDLSYTVHCETGDQYEISVNPQGRIGIQNRE